MSGDSEKTAEEKGCPFTEAQPEQMMIFEDSYHGITFSYKEYEKMHSPLAGQCQRENLATALEVIRCLNRQGYRITEAQVREGFQRQDGQDGLPACQSPRYFRRWSA